VDITAYRHTSKFMIIGKAGGFLFRERSLGILKPEVIKIHQKQSTLSIE
jgi:hypothetical protein